MRGIDVEARVLRAIDNLRSGRQVEDSRMELKSMWPEAGAKTARLIAGHANAARGEEALWVIGVDEKGRTVPGVPPGDLSSWWAQTSSYFNEMAPTLRDLVVPVDGVNVVALVFDSSRAPFVVSTEGGGRVQREVPWREAAGARSATRSELIRMLVPQTRLPLVDLVDAELNYLPPQPPTKTHFEWRLELWAFFAVEALTVVPFYRTRVDLTLPGPGNQLTFELVRLESSSPGASRGADELTLLSSCMVVLKAYRNAEMRFPVGPARIRVAIGAAGSDLPISLAVDLEFVGTDANGVQAWQLQR
jgi:hypothetical protein